jgi:uncharacterized protein (DUF433 family)
MMNQSKWYRDRNQHIAERWLDGETMEDLAQEYGLVIDTIRLIISEYLEAKDERSRTRQSESL